MERNEQPVGGWRVDMEANICPCRSWFKYQLCVHVLAALQATHSNFPGMDSTKERFETDVGSARDEMPMFVMFFR
ncbi:hypothetical protein JG687_00011437 [Phytophthora cactorum]|uniref:SWIM-type domain-containing protein n=1 Tax=Phytophthora cactorum TaxID=29920 RepID=A0A8T1U4K2_9STRA|nr:hypothetical protein JG687_00011437 [Phytophthora cactorum]